MGSHSRMQRHCPDSFSAAEDAFFADHGFTRAPLVVQWMATLRCPLDCAHCLSATNGTRPADMPLDQVESLIRQVAEARVPEFLVTGGEPLARPDLHEVVDLLHRYDLPWSLNTAAFPGPALRQAIERHPPLFVAVSLDGPPGVHDSFRNRAGSYDECLDSIRYFCNFRGTDVTAGTTVTTYNYPHLAETFHHVVASGADAWGIHLLLPEGKAAGRRDLFLDRKQLKTLLRFVARKRRHFPVGLADEFGYAGDWEPLVRDAPLSCGAGRAQCVILPDGSVVPCTTLDRSTAAGSLHERSLMEIWRNGFAELRHHQPEARCRACDFAAACEGGCWLQRRAGTQCFKEVWHTPGILKTAAGVVLCLGLAGAGHAAPPEDPPVRKPPVSRTILGDKDIESGSSLEQAILSHYAAPLPYRFRHVRDNRIVPLTAQAKKEPPAPPPDDPGEAFFQRWAAQGSGGGLDERIADIEGAIRSKNRSLGLISVLWRHLLEPTLDGERPHERRGKTRENLTRTLLLLGNVAEKWRGEILAGQLDPYLARGRIPLHHRFELSKAYRPAPPWVTLLRDTQVERWGTPAEGDADGHITEEYAKKHPYAEEMTLNLLLPKNREGKVYHPTGERMVDGADTLGIFEVLRAPEGEPTTLRVSWSGSPDATYDITLSPHADYTYLDLVRAVHEAHTDSLRKAAHLALARDDESRLLANPLHLLLYREAAKAPKNTDGRPTLSHHAPWFLSDFFYF
jgi:radical SAM protein with 4Fe4S-binding SPASM domain